jgi:hypothetical protein
MGERRLRSWWAHYDSLTVSDNGKLIVRWARRGLSLGLILFALMLPHSIAAAQISLGLSLAAWLVRDVVAGRFHFASTPMDRPLVCFIALTIVSSLLSVEPSLSLPKLSSLLLFGIVYLIATNLHPCAVRFFVALLLISGLVGVGYSLSEKLRGRGLIVTGIRADSPLAASELQRGDVIWLVMRRRVSSLEEATRIIHSYPVGQRIEIEALHAGDPLPLYLVVTQQMKAQSNPLGLEVGGRSRQFRVSGFTRHFLTYAEQMQIFALLVYGAVLMSLRSRRQYRRSLWLIVSLAIFALFSLALILTASRAVIAAFLISLLVISAVSGGKRVALIALLLALTLGSLALYVLVSARTWQVASFTDDSSARRLGYMRAGLRLIPQHPIWGVGMDAHKKRWAEWGFPGDYVTHTHSTPIQLAMDRGLPALGCYIWLMATMFALSWRGYKRARQQEDAVAGGLKLGVCAALTGFSASSLVNYNFGDSEVLMLLLFLVGLVIVEDNAAMNDKARAGLRS